MTHSDRSSYESDQHKGFFKLADKPYFLYDVDNASKKDVQDMLSELEVMKSLKPHPHVVKLIGCCAEKGNRHFYFFLFIFVMLFIFVVVRFDFTHFNVGNENAAVIAFDVVVF